MAERVQAELLKRLQYEVHDLCQPLTSLQCQLELGKMLGDPKALADAVNGALMETSRMFVAIARMREQLLKESEDEDVGHGGSRGEVV